MSVPPVPPHPNQGPPGKEGPPPAAREVPQLPADDPFADIVARRATHVDLIGQTKITAEERTATIQKRRADAADEAVAKGRALARQLRAAETGNTTVQLSEEHQQIMIAGGLEGAELGVDQVRGALQTALQRLSLSGNASIFRPDRHNATAQEGKRRLDGENTYVAVQAAAMELAREHMSAGNFSQGFATLGQFGIKIDELPEWVMHDVGEHIDAIDVATSGEALQQLAGLRNTIPIDLGEKIKAMDEAQDKAALSPFAKLFRKVEAAHTQIETTKRQQAEEAKNRKRTERLKTLEEDTYEAAIAAGRESFLQIESQSRTGTYFQQQVIQLEDRSDLFPIPFAALEAHNPEFKRILNDEATRNRGERLHGIQLHGIQLRALQRVVEDEDLLNACADTLAANPMTMYDWTGWRRLDYKEAGDENSWRDYWRTSLRRTIHGYTIGMMQQATEHADRGSFSENTRLQIARIGMEILFDDLNILHAEDVAKMDPMQIEARNRLGAYRSSLTEPARGTFDGYLIGNTEVLTLAATEVRDRKAAVVSARAQRLEKEEAVLRELADSEGAVASALVAIESLKLGEVEEARSFLTGLREFQGGIASQPFGTWVELRADKNRAQLVIPDKTRRALTAQRDQLAAQVQQSEGSPATQAVRTQLRGVEMQILFMEVLERTFRRANGATTVQNRSMLRGGDRRVFSTYGYDNPFAEPHEYQGEITDAVVHQQEEGYKGLFGEHGRYAKLQEKIRAEKEKLATESKTAIGKQNGITAMKTLAREGEEVAKAVQALVEKNKHGGVYGGDPLDYAARKFMHAVVLRELKTKNLIEDERHY